MLANRINRKVWCGVFGGLSVLAGGCTSEDLPDVPVVNDGEYVKASFTGEVGGATRMIDAGAFRLNEDKIGISCASDVIGGALSATDPMRVWKNIGATYAYDMLEDKNYFALDRDILYLSSEKRLFSAYYPYLSTETSSRWPGIYEWDDNKESIVINTGAMWSQRNQTTEGGSEGVSPAIDILFASGAEGSMASPEVSFKGNAAFKHLLAKVTVKFDITANDDMDIKYDEELNYIVKPSNLKSLLIKGLRCEGRFNPVTGQITLVQSEASTDMDLILVDADMDYFPSEDDKHEYIECTVYVLPQTSDISVLYDVQGETTDTEGEYGYGGYFITPTVSMTFTGGQAYELNVKVSPHRTTLQSTIVPWEVGSNNNLTLTPSSGS